MSEKASTGDSNSSSVLCVDVGGSSTKVGVVGSNGDVSHVDSLPTTPGVETFFDQLVAMIERTEAIAESSTGPSRQIGVAVAGFLNPERTCLAYNPNLPWLEQFPLKERLQERFAGSIVELEVDSNAATMAEYQFGSGQGKHRFLCLTSGTGLGVGMAIDGIPLRFAYGCMGDIGHTIVLRDGPLCTCGGRGCAEVMVSAGSISSHYRRLTGNERKISLRDVIDASRLGEDAAISVLSTAGEWLGIAIASLANTFYPDHIAVAGGLSAAGDTVLKPAELVFRETACTLATSGATLGCAKLGSMATLIGAAWPFWAEKEVQSNGKSVSR